MALQNKLLKFFPPPSFLDVPVAGIDMSDSSIKILSFRETDYGKIPIFFEERRISTGIIKNGEIKNKEDLTRVLTSLRIKYGLNFVRVSLPEETAYIFQCVIPSSEKEQMLNSIEFQLEENVPISPSEAIFDYDIISYVDAKDSVEVSVTVFPKSIIMDYKNVISAAGLTPIFFELEGQAIADAVISNGDTNTYMIVDFGRTKSELVIVRNGVVSFTSIIEVGGDELTKAVIKYFNVDEEEAQNIKREQRFINNKKNRGLYNSLMTTISAFKDELSRHYLYWNTKGNSTKNKNHIISKIILCGGNANISGLPEYLSSSMKIPVERANVWANVFSYEDYIPEIDYVKSLSYATAIGLALK